MPVLLESESRVPPGVPKVILPPAVVWKVTFFFITMLLAKLIRVPVVVWMVTPATAERSFPMVTSGVALEV